MTYSAERRSWVAPAAVFLIGFFVLTLIILRWGPSRMLDDNGGGDAYQYLSIAKSLATGNGYKNLVGPWPDRPTYDRMPGWPALLTVAVWLAPGAPPEVVSRFTCAFCLAISGMFFCLLTLRWGMRPWLAALAGLTVTLLPMSVSTVILGLSENAFLLFTSMGLWALLAGGRWIYLGALLFGLGPLVRTNFILTPVIFAALVLLLARRALLQFGLRRGLAAMLLACLPTMFWAARNYALTGRFPLLSSIEGETIYGSNNPVVANELAYWGYWVLPDQIPGEIPKLTLARRLQSDLALSDYYHQKGMEWIRGHRSALPRLVLGKLIRAFVPIPWVPSIFTAVAFFFRFLVWVLYLALWPWWWPVVNRLYLLTCLAMFVVHVLTVVALYGSSRFTHTFVEIFLVPCIFLGWEQGLALLQKPVRNSYGTVC